MNKKIVINIICCSILLIFLNIIIVPKVINSFKDADEDGFVAQIQAIVRKVNDDKIKNKSFTNATGKDSNDNKCNSKIDVKIHHSDFLYSLVVDENGNITKFNAKSDTYEYSYKGSGLLIKNVTKNNINNLENKDSKLEMFLCE